jgi:putative ABC transport system ATP-binding protein
MNGLVGHVRQAVRPVDTAHAVALRDVRKVYGTRSATVRALDGVTLDFGRGMFTAVMGPSGSGKSTLLQCAAGLDRPSSGEIVLGGTRLTGLSETKLTKLRRDRIGFVFQSFNLLPSLSAELNVALPLRLAGRRPSRKGRACGAGRGRAGGSGPAPAGRVVRRPAATGGHRPRAGHPPGRAVRGRADRCAGLGDRA